MILHFSDNRKIKRNSSAASKWNFLFLKLLLHPKHKQECAEKEKRALFGHGKLFNYQFPLHKTSRVSWGYQCRKQLPKKEKKEKRKRMKDRNSFWIVAGDSLSTEIDTSTHITYYTWQMWKGEEKKNPIKLSLSKLAFTDKSEEHNRKDISRREGRKERGRKRKKNQ